MVVQEIKMIEDNPEEYVFDLFTADYYKGHPLGMPVLGVEESVEGLTRDRLSPITSGTTHSPANTIITAVGRIDHDLSSRGSKNFSPALRILSRPPCFRHRKVVRGIKVYEKDLDTCICAWGQTA